MGDELPFPKAHVTGRGYGSLGEIDSGMCRCLPDF